MRNPDLWAALLQNHWVGNLGCHNHRGPIEGRILIARVHVLRMLADLRNHWSCPGPIKSSHSENFTAASQRRWQNHLADLTGQEEIPTYRHADMQVESSWRGGDSPDPKLHSPQRDFDLDPILTSWGDLGSNRADIWLKGRSRGE